MSNLIVCVTTVPLPLTYIQDLAGMAHDDIDPSVFSIRGDEQIVRVVVRYKILRVENCSNYCKMY